MNPTKDDYYPKIPPTVQTSKTTAAPTKFGNYIGTGLFASTDIQVGEDVVISKSPFVAVLDTSRLGDTCSGCFGRKQLQRSVQQGQVQGQEQGQEQGGIGIKDNAFGGGELRGCSGCHVVKYCDKVFMELIFFFFFFCENSSFLLERYM